MAATHNVSRPPPWSAAAELAKLAPWTLCAGASAALPPRGDHPHPLRLRKIVKDSRAKKSSSRGAAGGGPAALGLSTLDFSTL